MIVIIIVIIIYYLLRTYCGQDAGYVTNITSSHLNKPLKKLSPLPVSGDLFHLEPLALTPRLLLGSRFPATLSDLDSEAFRQEGFYVRFTDGKSLPPQPLLCLFLSSPRSLSSSLAFRVPATLPAHPQSLLPSPPS